MRKLPALLMRCSAFLDSRLGAGRVLTAVFFTLLLLLAGFGAAPRSEAQSTPLVSARVGLPFAIADFDGDSRPDTARVYVSGNGSADPDYLLELQLSAVGRRSIRIAAPYGGLRIVASDVNGDTFVDLVVSTAWSNQPVAIYLNDGHGSFTRAEPAAFPNAFSGSQQSLTLLDLRIRGVVGSPPQSQDAVYPNTRWLSHLRVAGKLVAASCAGFYATPFLSSFDCRAPPLKISLP